MNFSDLMEIPMNDFYFDELSKQCVKREVIPFVGAGFSYPTYPLWKDYIIKLAKDFVIDDVVIREMIDDYKYEDATNYIHNIIKHRAFNDHIRANFGTKKIKNIEITGPVTYLPSIFRDTVITTNFDCMLEYVYKKNGNEFEMCVFSSQFTKIFESIKERHHYLIKIHGDVDGRADIVLTKEQYDELYGDSLKDPKPFVKLLERYMIDKSLLFLGCSINNDRTISTLYEVTRKFKDICHYAILEKPKEDDEFRERLSFLSEHGIRPIWFPNGQFEYLNVFLKELSDRCKRVYENKQTNILLRKLVCEGIEFLENEANIFFNKDKSQYDFVFKKHFIVLMENIRWFKSQIYANKILDSYEEAKKYYVDNVLQWESLGVRAFISTKKNTDREFTPFVEVKVRNHSDRGNHIPFDILYETLTGEVISLAVDTEIIIKYKYSIPTKFWGSYINRSSTFFNEQLIVKFSHQEDVDFKIYELKNNLNDIEGNLVEVQQIEYYMQKGWDVHSDLMTTTIILPQKRCGRWRIFWDAEKYFEKDFNSFGRDLLRETTY